MLLSTAKLYIVLDQSMQYHAVQYGCYSDLLSVITVYDAIGAWRIQDRRRGHLV